MLNPADPDVQARVRQLIDGLVAPNPELSPEAALAHRERCIEEWSALPLDLVMLTAGNMRVERRLLDWKLEMLDDVLMQRFITELGVMKYRGPGYSASMQVKETKTISAAKLVALGVDQEIIDQATKTSESDPYLIFRTVKLGAPEPDEES